VYHSNQQGILQPNALSGECHIVTTFGTPCLKYNAANALLQLAATFHSYFSSPFTLPRVCHPYRNWVPALDIAMVHSCLPSFSGHCHSSGKSAMTSVHARSFADSFGGHLCSMGWDAPVNFRPVQSSHSHHWHGWVLNASLSKPTRKCFSFVAREAPCPHCPCSS
jgi:hypothetical protein